MFRSEKEIDEYLERQQEKAWEMVKGKMAPKHMNLHPEIIALIKSAFMVGHSLGSIHGEEDIKKMSKEDPITFYEWLKD